MASCQTEQFGGTYKANCPYIKLDVSTSIVDGDTMRIYWTLYFIKPTSGGATVTSSARSWSVTVAGKTWSGTYDIDRTGTHTISSGYVDVDRYTYAYNASFSCSMAFNLTYNGVYGGTKSASDSVGISAKASYTVSYNANGGSGAPGAQTKWFNTRLTLSTTKPTRSNYTFKNWNDKADGSGTAYTAGDYTDRNESFTLYAQWTPITYSVSYDANGGTGAPAKQTYPYAGTNIKLSTTVPTRENYEFLGWSLSKDATEAAYVPGQEWSSKNAQQYTLYAVWKLAYIPPKISNAKATRCDASGNPSDKGTYCKIELGWELCQLTGENPISSIKYYIDDTVEGTTIPSTGTSGTVSKVIGGNFGARGYNIKVEVIDSKGGSDYENLSLIPTHYHIAAHPYMNAVGFFGVPTREGVEIFGDLPLYVNGYDMSISEETIEAFIALGFDPSGGGAE